MKSADLGAGVRCLVVQSKREESSAPLGARALFFFLTGRNAALGDALNDFVTAIWRDL